LIEFIFYNSKFFFDRFLSRINPSTHVPDYATYVSALLCLALVVIIDVKDLVGFTDISGFLCYSSVALGLLVVRYYDSGVVPEPITSINQNEEFAESSLESNSDGQIGHNVNRVKFREDERSNLLAVADVDDTSASTTDLISIRTSSAAVASVSTNKNTCLAKVKKWLNSTGVFKYKENALGVIALIYISNVTLFGLMHNLVMVSKVTLAVVALVLNVVLGVVLSVFEQTRMPGDLSFRVPLVPFVPILAIVVNTYLMMTSDYTEWIVFAIVLLSGMQVFLNIIVLERIKDTS
jgi:amino acid transporter